MKSFVSTKSVLSSLCLLLLAACSASSDAQTPAANTDAGVPDVVSGPTLEERIAKGSWAKLSGPSVSQGKQDDIFFTSTSVGYAASGMTGALYKTTDAGETWAPTFKQPSSFFRSVLFLDDAHGFVGNLGAGLTSSVSDTTLIYETKDSGATWNAITNITGSSPGGICNLTLSDDKKAVFGIGRANGPAHMMRSTDSGASWTAVDLSSHLSMAIDAHFSSADEGVIVGGSASTPMVCTAIRTTDGGKTFTPVFSSKATNSLCWKVQFPSASVGYIANQQTSTGPASFGKTDDGGKTWRELPLPEQSPATKGYAALAVGFINDKIGWVGGDSAKAKVYRTLDGGETWEVDETIQGPINRFRFVGDKVAYAIGGAIWKFEIPAE